ncbi:L-tyrosine/L-tryptophan isonitrile synthase family protein, partial [Cereibacter changlensis]
MTETEFSAWLETFAPKIHPLEGQETAEAIYSVFADPGVVFGDPAFLSSRREEWLQRFGQVVAEGRRLDLTILGFPYKMPVPLKTDRTAADLGEVVSLARLNQLARAIGRVHAPGARIHVFTEGAFHVFNSLDRSYADGYFASLQALASRFGLNEHVEL